MPISEASAPTDPNVPRTNPVFFFVLSDIPSALCSGNHMCMPRLANMATASRAEYDPTVAYSTYPTPVINTAAAARHERGSRMVKAAINIRARPGSSRIPSSHSTCPPVSPSVSTKKLVRAPPNTPSPKRIIKTADAIRIRLGVQMRRSRLKTKRFMFFFLGSTVYALPTVPNTSNRRSHSARNASRTCLVRLNIDASSVLAFSSIRRLASTARLVKMLIF